MSERIYLVGSEDVRRGGSACISAADGMQRAAANIDTTFEINARKMDDWLNRFEALVERMEVALRSTKES